MIHGILERPQGHHLAGFTIREQTFLICLRCGAWSHMRAKLLDVRCCRQPAPAGKTALGLLRRGLYPHGDAKFRDLRVETVFPLVGFASAVNAGHWHAGPVVEQGLADAMDQ